MLRSTDLCLLFEYLRQNIYLSCNISLQLCLSKKCKMICRSDRYVYQNNLLVLIQFCSIIQLHLFVIRFSHTSFKPFYRY